MDQRQQTGRQGEDIAAAYFVKKGYRILQRNWRCPVGELDIVMEDGPDTLVFVEVRARRSPQPGLAEESITPAKQSRLIELAQTYLQETRAAHPAWRIDIAAIYVGPRSYRINHIKNAVGW